MGESTPTLALAVGDRVVYPNQGVCRVSGIDVMEIAGQKLTFISMKLEEDGSVVRVPQAKVASIGVRKVASRDEVSQMLAFLKSDSDKADLDWKQRARTNLDRMTQGGLLGLAEVVKGLQVLSELRPLPTKERELYDSARHLLVSEMSVSLGISVCDAEDAVDTILFPVGKERPKRTVEEFKQLRGDDGLDLGDDLVSMDESLDSEEGGGEEGEEEPAEAGEQAEQPTKKGKGEKAAPRKVALSDDEATQPMGTAIIPDEELPGPRRRGRPPKPKPDPRSQNPIATSTLPAPRKRGRPPKPKPPEAAAPEPKKRGRPPKAAADKVAKKKK